MPRSSVEVLRKAGFEAEDVRSVGLEAAMDNRIIKHARAEELVILTRDTDFGQVLRHPEHPGALILRLRYTYTARQINGRLETFLEEVDASELSGATVIVELGLTGDGFSSSRLALLADVFASPPASSTESLAQGFLLGAQAH